MSCEYCSRCVLGDRALISSDDDDGIVSLIAWPEDLLDSVSYERRPRPFRWLARRVVDDGSPSASADGPWLVSMAFCDDGMYCGGFAIDINFCPFCGRDLRKEG